MPTAAFAFSGSALSSSSYDAIALSYFHVAVGSGDLQVDDGQ